MENETKLSIQVSLNGLSFCVLDTATNTVLKAEKSVFAKKLTPYGLLKRLKSQFSQNEIRLDRFSEVVVVHRNTLFGLVPRPLFDADELPNYLKVSSNILANDHLAYDELEAYDMVNVFVPFVNVNNYIYEGFGAFTFKHSGTVMLESLPVRQADPDAVPDFLSRNRRSEWPGESVDASENQAPSKTGGGQSSGKQPECYVHVFERQMDVAVILQNRLLLFNSFDFVTKEDFLYYLLFTIEQLQLDTNTVAVKLFGDIEEDDDIFELCYQYIKNVAIIIPAFSDGFYGNDTEKSLDFTVLNAF